MPNEAAFDLAWVVAKPEPYQALAKSLEAHGFRSAFLAPPKGPLQGSLADWLEKNVPKDAKALLIDGDDLKWIDIVCGAIRYVTSPGLSFAPILWVHPTLDVPLFERVARVGVDEVLLASDDPGEISIRLKIRISQSDAVRRLQKQLDERSKRDAALETAMRQREEFLGVCAHDLRSPMGLVETSLGMLIEGEHRKSLTPFALDLLTRARRQAGVAIRLVNDLLDVMSLEQGLKPQYELFNLHEFLLEFYQDYKSLAEEKGIHFHYENTVTDWYVLADSDRVRQLLQNLLGNAVKFTESGKNIFLNVTPFQGRRRTDPPYPMIMISFRDEGKGIPREEVERIFDRFSQIKDYSRAGGRGLGLTVAKQISTLHAGNLWVETEMGKGSKFNVLLPHVISRVQIESAESSKGEAKRVLAVEPVDAKRGKNFEALEKAGYQITFVRDGVEAVAMAFYLRPDFVILRHDVSKLREGEVARMLRSHPLTASVRLLLGLEEGEAANKIRVSDGLLDGIVRIPAEPKEIQAAARAARAARPDTKKTKAAA